MDTRNYFTEAFKNKKDMEAVYRTIIMNEDSEEAAKIREGFFRAEMKHLGKDVHFGARVKIVNPQWISIGDGVSVGDDVTIIARGPGEEGASIIIGNGVTVTQRVYLDSECSTGYIKVGDHVYIGTGTTLFGHSGLEIGEHSLLAQNITITPYSHKFEDVERPIIEQGGHTRKVTIGRDCYLGMRVCVLYSADIGDGSVIGSGSVVVKPIPPYSVAVGNPAHVIRKRGDKKGKV